MSDLADHGIHVESLDVTDDGSMVTVVDKIMSEHGRIDILVNNAGYGSYGQSRMCRSPKLAGNSTSISSGWPG